MSRSGLALGLTLLASPPTLAEEPVETSTQEGVSYEDIIDAKAMIRRAMGSEPTLNSLPFDTPETVYTDTWLILLDSPEAAMDPVTWRVVYSDLSPNEDDCTSEVSYWRYLPPGSKIEMVERANNGAVGARLLSVNASWNEYFNSPSNPYFDVEKNAADSSSTFWLNPDFPKSCFTHSKKTELGPNEQLCFVPQVVVSIDTEAWR